MSLFFLFPRRCAPLIAPSSRFATPDPSSQEEGTTGCIGSVQLFNQFLQLCFGGFRQQAREVCHHSFI